MATIKILFCDHVSHRFQGFQMHVATPLQKKAQEASPPYKLEFKYACSLEEVPDWDWLQTQPQCANSITMLEQQGFIPDIAISDLNFIHDTGFSAPGAQLLGIDILSYLVKRNPKLIYTLMTQSGVSLHMDLLTQLGDPATEIIGRMLIRDPLRYISVQDQLTGDEWARLLGRLEGDIYHILQHGEELFPLFGIKKIDRTKFRLENRRMQASLDIVVLNRNGRPSPTYAAYIYDLTKKDIGHVRSASKWEGVLYGQSYRGERIRSARDGLRRGIRAAIKRLSEDRGISIECQDQYLKGAEPEPCPHCIDPMLPRPESPSEVECPICICPFFVIQNKGERGAAGLACYVMD